MDVRPAIPDRPQAIQLQAVQDIRGIRNNDGHLVPFIDPVQRRNEQEIRIAEARERQLERKVLADRLREGMVPPLRQEEMEAMQIGPDYQVEYINPVDELQLVAIEPDEVNRIEILRRRNDLVVLPGVDMHGALIVPGNAVIPPEQQFSLIRQYPLDNNCKKLRNHEVGDTYIVARRYSETVYPIDHANYKWILNLENNNIYNFCSQELLVDYDHTFLARQFDTYSTIEYFLNPNLYPRSDRTRETKTMLYKSSCKIIYNNKPVRNVEDLMHSFFSALLLNQPDKIIEGKDGIYKMWARIFGLQCADWKLWKTEWDIRAHDVNTSRFLDPIVRGETSPIFVRYNFVT